MIKFILLAIAVLALALTVPIHIRADDSEADTDLVGSTVTVISDVATLTSNGNVIGEVELGESFKVDAVKGDLLFIKSRNAYLARRDAVPYLDAIDFFTNRIRSAPTSDLYDQRGRCWQKRGALKMAIADFEHAIRFDPQNYASYVNRGIAWEEDHDLDKAIADFDAAIRIRPNYDAAILDRGVAWSKKGDYEKAIADYDTMIRLYPNLVMTYNNRGRAYLEQGDLDKAMSDLNEAIRRDPNYARPRNNRGNVWIKKHEYDKAIADSTEAIRLNSRDARHFITRGNARIAKGQDKQGFADLEHASGLDPAMARNSLAWLRATSTNPKLRDGERAVQDATTACKLADWKNDAYLDTLSAALAESGRFDEAVEQLQMAIDLNPEMDQQVRSKMMTAFKSHKPYRDDEHRLLP
jgi:tetratricopeptide (TPR) repeat protein